MSVQTEADDRLDDARRQVKSAVSNLSKIVVDECWGSDEYTKEFKARINDSFHTLIKVRDDLDA